MPKTNRRGFLRDSLLATSAVAAANILPNEAAVAANPTGLINLGEETDRTSTPVDFRYAPRVRQTAFCFPDDPDKSLTDEVGTLLYGYDSKHGIDRFPLKVGFGMNGMKPARSVEQQLEEPGIPILTTVFKWDDVTLTLTTFATNRTGEGRYDNVVIQVRGHSDKDIEVEPVLTVASQSKWKLEQKDDVACVSREGTQEFCSTHESTTALRELEFKGHRNCSH